MRTIGVNEAFTSTLLDCKCRMGMLSSYTSELVLSDDRGRKAAAVDDTYHAKANLFRIDMSRKNMIAIYCGSLLNVGFNGHLLADSGGILVENERLLGGKEDLFIIISLIPALS